MGRGYRTRAQAERIGVAVLQALGVTSLDGARALPVQALLDAQNRQCSILIYPELQSSD